MIVTLPSQLKHLSFPVIKESFVDVVRRRERGIPFHNAPFVRCCVKLRWAKLLEFLIRVHRRFPLAARVTMFRSDPFPVLFDKQY